MKSSKVSAAVALGALILTLGNANAYQGSKLAPQAKITISQARAIALGTAPGGKIVAEELEKEAGGSGLRYTFDVKVKSKTREIGVDAKTGKVLENAVEGSKPD